MRRLFEKGFELPKTTLLFSLTLFLSAALMFTVQPMVGKMLLPLYGGAPSVWLAAMSYFQVALLAGYLLAFLLSKFSAQRQMLVVIALLVAGFMVQPILIKEMTGAEAPPWGIVMILAANLSLCFLPIASLSPSLQRLYACRSANPYFLFAASNLGSFVGLLAYPFVLENWVGLSQQAEGWRWVYAALIALCSVCLLSVRRSTENNQASSVAKEVAPTITWKQRGLWVILAFVPSSLMMGVTSRVTMDTGAVPLFWVLPLALYLLTMVRAFAEKDNRATIGTLLPYQTALSLLVVAPLHTITMHSSLIGVVLLLGAFTVAARTFHAWLAMEKPPAAALTQYYLWLALGGALGGVFNTFVVPLLFPTAIEFTLVLLLGLFFILRRFGIKWDEPVGMMISSITLIAVLVAALFASAENALLVILEVVVLVFLMLFSMRPALFGVVLLGIGLGSVSGLATGALDVHRNFFGIMKVSEAFREGVTARQLVHGTTVHGMQQVAPEKKTDVTTYYLPLGPVLDAVQAKQVGMIGFGVGTSLCHTAPGRQFTVYEIDPDVIVLADKWFDYIRTCGRPTFKIGDGRKVLQDDQDARYDALIVDAFSSDAIPVHLLTKEAAEIYLSRLSQTGVLAFHISNRYYDLRPQLAALAKTLGLVAVFRQDVPDKKKTPLATESHWVVMAQDGRPIEVLKKQRWTVLSDQGARVWTDDRSNALSALRVQSKTQK